MFRYIYIVFFFLFVDSFSQEYNINEYDGQTINTCSGNFYDSGGPSGVYSANEDYTITICPENDLQLIELDFTSFTSQPVQNGNGDGLEIYDGVNTSAPLIKARATETRCCWPPESSPGLCSFLLERPSLSSSCCAF